MAEESKSWSSRKYRTGWYLTILSTVALIAPFVTGFFISGTCTELISGAQWLTFLFGIWGVYFSANVAEKHMVFQSKDTKLEVIDSDPLKDGD